MLQRRRHEPDLTAACVRLFPGERGPLPHFAGRKAELAALTEMLGRAAAQGRMEGGLRLITGIPGAGKTSLGRRFAQLASERRGIKHKWFSVETLESEVGAFLRVGESIGAAKAVRRIAERDAKMTRTPFPDLRRPWWGCRISRGPRCPGSRPCPCRWRRR